MGRLSAPLLACILAAAMALGLSACGGSDADLLPGDTASEITANLDQVRDLVGEGECVGAADAAQEVSAQVNALGGVDKKLKQALQEGATRLNEVVASCEEAPEEETEPAVETAIEPEDEEEPKKEKAEKPEKTKPEKGAEEEPEETETEALPPQAEGKAKGHEKQEEAVPPAETGGGTPAGGVGPGAAVEENGGD
jgi:outer membrane biosynthesis protein TonB